MEDLVHTTNAQSAARPSLESAFPPSPSTLIDRTKDFVKEYMSHYDASHDYQHILRVLALAQHILKAEQQSNPSTFYDPITVTLAALLHDVGDHKYPNPSSTTEDPATLAKSTLISLGAPHSQATYVQTIIKSVSYSHEILNPDRVRGVLFQHPELAIVQDADRLDAIGAVGIGRTFTYGGARGCKGMEETIKHFEEKLEKLEGMMKTAEGKRLARERTKKLRIFKGWWLEENALVKGLE
ncbi:hypothetical protein MMC24_006455 [Lignoscripta atroalba]|nr:hypothetical protein [Lignoscripta atroalba]